MGNYIIYPSMRNDIINICLLTVYMSVCVFSRSFFIFKFSLEMMINSEKQPSYWDYIGYTVYIYIYIQFCEHVNDPVNFCIILLILPYRGKKQWSVLAVRWRKEPQREKMKHQ